jgi:hypothetical protein
VSNRVANTISLIDTQTLTVVDELPGPGGPDDMDLMADGRTLLLEFALGAQAQCHRHREQEGGAADRRRALAARGLDAGPCAARQ